MRKLLTYIILLLIATPASAQAGEEVMQYLSQRHATVFSNDNTLQLLPNATIKMKALLQDLREAQHSIHMDYFALLNDSISQEVYTVLRQRASAGVEVRVIIDALGNGKRKNSLKPADIKDLRRAGIEVIIFGPPRFPWVKDILHREHRKMVIIDGHIAYTGGMNIADYYLKGKPSIGAWRDMHVRITGEVCAEFQRTFISFWNLQTGQNLRGEAYYHTLPMPPALPSLLTATGTTMGFITRTPSATSAWPYRQNSIARDTYCAAIDAARRHIQIVNPYFAPSPRLRRALRRAIERGVDVEIMISACSDINVTPRIVEHSAHRMMKLGARIHVFEGGFHHSKIMTVDDSLSIVGSINMDHRSLYCDYEDAVVVISPTAVQHLQSIYEADKHQCFPLTPETWRTRFSRSQRHKAWMATILRPFV